MSFSFHSKIHKLFASSQLLKSYGEKFRPKLLTPQILNKSPTKRHVQAVDNLKRVDHLSKRPPHYHNQPLQRVPTKVQRLQTLAIT